MTPPAQSFTVATLNNGNTVSRYVTLSLLTPVFTSHSSGTIYAVWKRSSRLPSSWQPLHSLDNKTTHITPELQFGLIIPTGREKQIALKSNTKKY
jgi:hypothetical protein